MTKREYCLYHCPHANEPCGNQPCEEYRRKFSKSRLRKNQAQQKKDGA